MRYRNRELESVGLSPKEGTISSGLSEVGGLGAGGVEGNDDWDRLEL